jgi:hypothetical protein
MFCLKLIFLIYEFLNNSAIIHPLNEDCVGELVKMSLTTSLHEHTSHLPLSIFFLIPFNFHTPANSQITPFLSFLVQHSTVFYTQSFTKTKIHPKQSATENYWTVLETRTAFPQHYIFLLPVY